MGYCRKLSVIYREPCNVHLIYQDQSSPFPPALTAVKPLSFTTLAFNEPGLRFTYSPKITPETTFRHRIKDVVHLGGEGIALLAHDI